MSYSKDFMKNKDTADKDPQCAHCIMKYCRLKSIDNINKMKLPHYCPMKTKKDQIDKSIKLYDEKDIQSLYVPATITEKEAYQTVRGIPMAVRSRIKELMEFSKLLKVKKIGIAFCTGLSDETARLTHLLEKQDFTVISIICKCGGTDKSRLHISNHDKIQANRFEAACNPILQAELLNDAGTDINVIVGLCIGHDMLFTQFSKAPVTTLIVKDRLLGHNPVIGLYSSYHQRIQQAQKRK